MHSHLPESVGAVDGDIGEFSLVRRLVDSTKEELGGTRGATKRIGKDVWDLGLLHESVEEGVHLELADRLEGHSADTGRSGEAEGSTVGDAQGLVLDGEVRDVKVVGVHGTGSSRAVTVRDGEVLTRVLGRRRGLGVVRTLVQDGVAASRVVVKLKGALLGGTVRLRPTPEELVLLVNEVDAVWRLALGESRKTIGEDTAFSQTMADLFEGRDVGGRREVTEVGLVLPGRTGNKSVPDRDRLR